MSGDPDPRADASGRSTLDTPLSLVDNWRDLAEQLTRTDKYTTNWLAQREVARLRECARQLDAALASLDQSEHDEEMTPHAFNPIEDIDTLQIWCKDRAYHRDHQIHQQPAASLDPAPQTLVREFLRTWDKKRVHLPIPVCVCDHRGPKELAVCNWCNGAIPSVNEAAALRAASLDGPREVYPPDFWQIIYDAAADEGSILHDDTVSRINNAVRAGMIKLQAGSIDGPRPQQSVPLTLWQELRDALAQDDQTLLFRLKQMDIGRDRDVWVRELDAQMTEKTKSRA